MIWKFCEIWKSYGNQVSKEPKYARFYLTEWGMVCMLCKTVTSKRPKIGFQDQLSLNWGQKYCRMHSAILSTFIKLRTVIKFLVLSIFEWPFYTLSFNVL